MIDVHTSCTTRYLKPLLQSGEGDHYVDKGHRLYSTKEAIYRDEVFRGGTISQPIGINPKNSTTFAHPSDCAVTLKYSIFLHRLEMLCKFYIKTYVHFTSG